MYMNKEWTVQRDKFDEPDISNNDKTNHTIMSSEITVLLLKNFGSDSYRVDGISFFYYFFLARCGKVALGEYNQKSWRQYFDIISESTAPSLLNFEKNLLNVGYSLCPIKVFKVRLQNFYNFFGQLKE